jgi:hypothetical protein
MQTWEYLHVVLEWNHERHAWINESSDEETNDRGAFLNNLGADGWELVGVTPVGEEAYNTKSIGESVYWVHSWQVCRERFYFKRPKE